MNGLPQRSLELSDRHGLIERRRRQAASAALMSGTVCQGFRRFKRPAAGGADRSGKGCKIRPTGGAEIRDAGVPHGRSAVGTGRRENKIENAAEKAHKDGTLPVTKHAQ
jgi:hypothetical protein